jgi:activator of HSP90 ATPase
MKSFSKKNIIKAKQEDVFAALTHAKAIAGWSGTVAKKNAKQGSVFSLWGGSIHGKNVTVAKDKIVQQWKEKNWEGFSTVTFNLSETKTSTIGELVHQAIRQFFQRHKRWLGPLLIKKIIFTNKLNQAK